MKPRTHRGIAPSILVGLALLFGGCVTQKTVTLDVEEAPAAVDRIAIRQIRSAENAAVLSTSADTVRHVHETTEVEIGVRGAVAFETGTFTGHIGNARGEPVQTGRYTAEWIKREGKWIVRAEVRVPLTCKDAGCPPAP